MNRKYNEGMTLVEVIIAMAMLAIILGAFLDAYSSGYTWVYETGTRTQEDFTDQQAMDKALGYSGAVPAVAETLTIQVGSLDCDVPGNRLTSGPFVAFRPD